MEEQLSGPTVSFLSFHWKSGNLIGMFLTVVLSYVKKSTLNNVSIFRTNVAKNAISYSSAISA
jgi:hypothetical protein